MCTSSLALPRVAVESMLALTHESSASFSPTDAYVSGDTALCRDSSEVASSMTSFNMWLLALRQVLDVSTSTVIPMHACPSASCLALEPLVPSSLKEILSHVGLGDAYFSDLAACGVIDTESVAVLNDPHCTLVHMPTLSHAPVSSLPSPIPPPPALPPGIFACWS